jgi:hypothetical protein
MDLTSLTDIARSSGPILHTYYFLIFQRTKLQKMFGGGKVRMLNFIKWVEKASLLQCTIKFTRAIHLSTISVTWMVTNMSPHLLVEWRQSAYLLRLLSYIIIFRFLLIRKCSYIKSSSSYFTKSIVLWIQLPYRMPVSWFQHVIKK